MTFQETKLYLEELAQKYETKDFLTEDPSYFMHQVEGKENQEIMALIASCLSYGSRKLFFPKIQLILDKSKYNPYHWVKTGNFQKDIPPINQCFYRLYTYKHINLFLERLQTLLLKYNTLGQFVQLHATNGYEAVQCITAFFSQPSPIPLIPKNTISACKRICMFLRWLVRNNSPVDLGLWSNFINPQTLIIPLDTHVLREAHKLNLIHSKTGSMKTALALTNALKQFFPNDPLKADFALFGYGVNHS